MGGQFGLPALAIDLPQQEGPLQQVGKLAQLKGAMQQQQAGQVSLLQQKQALADQQAATAAMHEWDGKDFTQLPTLMLKHGASATAVIGMKQHILTQQETLSKMAQQDAETGSKNVATTAAKNDLALGQLQTLNDVPDEQLPQQLTKISSDLANAGLIDPQHAQAAQQLAQLPPPQLRKALALYEKSMMGQKEQFAQTQKQQTDAADIYKNTQQGNEANIGTQQKALVLAGTSPTGVTAAQQQEQQSRAQQLRLESQRNFMESQRVRLEAERIAKESKGVWSVQEDPTGKPLLFNNKTGEVKDAPAQIAKPGTYQKQLGGAEESVQYAKDYLEGKNYTGPGDEALMEKFFDVAKPSSGFRMTQPQMDMLNNARDAYQGLLAKGKHLLSPNAPYFDDTQRQHIVDTMNNIIAAKRKAHGIGGSSDGGGQSSGKVLPMSAIQQAAKDHGVSVEEATRQAKAAGYSIQ